MTAGFLYDRERSLAMAHVNKDRSNISVFIGITGHRFLSEQDRLAAGIEAALSCVEQAFPERGLAVLSPLAEGTDRLVAHQALRRSGSLLIVPLPLPQEEYMMDFESTESKQEFLSLLKRADKVIELPAAPARDEAYEVALKGRLPMVFFDEFDSDFNGKLGWLKYFLAPMQDGAFRDGETIHPLGKAIFVFAGGTCSTFNEFCRHGDASKTAEAPVQPTKSYQPTAGSKRSAAEDGFKAAKGPDFVSRLRGYVNITGADPTGDGDNMYMIRRALTLRSLLERNARQLIGSDGKVRIDDGVLRALIKVPKYKHGIRSMQAILEMSMLAGRSGFEQAALPSPRQLELHVDPEIFSRLVVRNVLLGAAKEDLAKAFHARHLRLHAEDRSPDDPSMQPWEELREDLRESNRQLADHIPTKLKAVRCGFTPIVGREPTLTAFSPEEVEKLSQMEHDRWTSERFLSGWSYGPKVDRANKISPYLVPWDQLPDEIREWDRVLVRAMPEVMADAKFEVYRLK